MVCVYAFAKVKPGCEDAFLNIAKTLVNHTRAEAGNIQYYLGRESEQKFVFLEVWKDDEAVTAHLNMPHFAAAGKEMEPLLAEPLEINKVEGIM